MQHCEIFTWLASTSEQALSAKSNSLSLCRACLHSVCWVSDGKIDLVLQATKDARSNTSVDGLTCGG